MIVHRRPAARRALRLLAASLIAAAWPVVALGQTNDVTLDGLSFTVGPVTYRVGRIVLRGSGLTRDEAAGLLSPSSPDALGERLLRVSAAEIAIPEVVADVATPSGPQTTTYRDVVLRGVAAGRIGTASVAGGSLAAAGRDAGRFGRIEATALDLPYVVGLYGSRAPAGPLRPVYGSVAIADLQVTDPQGQTTRVGRLAGTDLRAGPTRDGWSATIAALAGPREPDEATPADRARTGAALAELLRAFSVGAFEASDIAVGTGNDRGRIDRVTLTGSAGGGIPSLRIEGLDLASDGSRLRIASAAVAAADPGSVLTGLVALGDRPPETIGAGDLQSLVPSSGSVRLSGLSIEPSGTSPAPEARAALGSVEIALDTPVKGSPGTLRLKADGLDWPVGTEPLGAGLGPLAAFGYRRLRASGAGELAWIEGRQELVLRDLSFAAADLGRVRIGATLAGVGRDVFDRDAAIASVALVGAALTSLDLTIENGGLAERMIARQARDSGATPDDVRRTYGVAAAFGMPALIGSSPAARALGQAVSRFIAKPGRLTVTAKAKNPAGLAVADFALSPEPGAILEKLDVTATAE